MMRKRNKYSTILITSLLLAMFGASSMTLAQSSQNIEIPDNLDSEINIMRFIQELLNDSVKRKDPFASGAVGTGSAVSYGAEDKPRPESGIGKYDVDSLILMAIWEESADVVAMVKAPDDLTFIVRVGDEFYDGKIVVIDRENRQVKTLNKLVRKDDDLLVNEPKEKWVENFIKFRK